MEQLVQTTMTGSELKEYLEDAFALYLVSKCEHEWERIDYKRIHCIKCEQIESRM